MRARLTGRARLTRRAQPPHLAKPARRAHRAQIEQAGSESGSVLVLVPAAVLVLAILGAIAVDSGAGFLGQRQLAQEAQAAAEDATTQLSTTGFYHSGALSLDASAAKLAAQQAVAAQRLSGVQLTGPVGVSVSGAQVCVSLQGRVPVVFGAAIPGAPKWIAVSAHSTATAAGYLGPAVPRGAPC